MRIKYLSYLLIAFLVLVVDAGAMIREQLFDQYIDRLSEISGKRLSDDQINELRRPRTLRGYNPDFIRTPEYEERRHYRDIAEALLIAKWKRHNPGLLWRADHELHHIVPLGYGGRNEWWNIFPLTFRDHRAENTGIHRCIEFRQLFPNVR